LLNATHLQVAAKTVAAAGKKNKDESCKSRHPAFCSSRAYPDQIFAEAGKTATLQQPGGQEKARY
jgi:hypothetical protein